MCAAALIKCIRYGCLENTYFDPSECFVIEDFLKPSSHSVVELRINIRVTALV